MKKTVWTIGLAIGCVWCLSLVASASDDAADGDCSPVCSVDSLMHGQGWHFKTLNGLLTKKQGSKRIRRIFREAEILAELANVNVRFADGRADYKKWASAVRDKALAIAKEAKKKKNADEDQMKKLFRQIKHTCGDCHDVYQD